MLDVKISGSEFVRVCNKRLPLLRFCVVHQESWRSVRAVEFICECVICRPITRVERMEKLVDCKSL